MGDYWDDDEKVVEHFIRFFHSDNRTNYDPPVWDSFRPFEWHLGGKIWVDRLGSATGPYDGQIVLCQKDGTRDPEITINIKVHRSNRTYDYP